MRDKNSIDEILTALGKYWKTEDNQNLSLGELISVLNEGNDVFYFEDKRLLNIINPKSPNAKTYTLIGTAPAFPYIKIQPVGKEYTSETETPILLSVANLYCDDIKKHIYKNHSIYITKNQVKEMIKALQEIVDCIEGE